MYRWAAPCEKSVFGHIRTVNASALFDQGLYCPLTESLDTIECMNGEKMAEMILCACAG